MMFRMLHCLALAALVLTGCAITAPSSVGGGSDHEPHYDYWENGGGACCPHHAQQAGAARKS